MKLYKNINKPGFAARLKSKICLYLLLSLSTNFISSCAKSRSNSELASDLDARHLTVQSNKSLSRSLLGDSSTQLIEFDLIDVSRGSVVPGFANLQNNQTLNLKSLPLNLSVVARVASSLNVKSVKIALGNISKVEGEAPYALFGDSDGSYKSQKLPLGELNLVASAHSASRAKGDLLARAQIKLLIVDSVSGGGGETGTMDPCSNGLLHGQTRSVNMFSSPTVIAPAVCQSVPVVVETCTNGILSANTTPTDKFLSCVVEQPNGGGDTGTMDPCPNGLLHGETRSVNMFSSPTVIAPAVCQSVPVAVEACNDGILEPLPGPTNKFLSCVVEEPSGGGGTLGSMTPVLADRLEHAGITWFFDKAYPTGQFVTGDKWVVGPVTITRITPEDTNMGDATDLHGTMLNPTKDTNGLDSRVKGDRYARQYNIARSLPKTISGVSSVLSGISIDNNYVGKIAVLTVLNSAPELGSFRPAYYGSAQKQMLNVSRINMSVFARKEATVSVESPTKLYNDGLFQHPLLELFSGGASANSSFKAKDQGPHYGREIAKEAVKAGLALNTNFSDAEKRPLLIRVIQRGIDIYGAMMQGYTPEADGGHRHGRKLHMYIAAKALGASEILLKIKDKAYQKFQEDQQFRFRDNDGVADWGPSADLAKWHAQTPESWDNTGYRFINGQSAVGLVMVLSFMNGQAEWNNDALFEYVKDSYWPKEKNSPDRGIGSANGIPRATHEMWTKHMQ